jgi:hypothetical protein
MERFSYPVAYHGLQSFGHGPQPLLASNSASMLLEDSITARPASCWIVSHCVLCVKWVHNFDLEKQCQPSNSRCLWQYPLRLLGMLPSNVYVFCMIEDLVGAEEPACKKLKTKISTSIKESVD